MDDPEISQRSSKLVNDGFLWTLHVCYDLRRLEGLLWKVGNIWVIMAHLGLERNVKSAKPRLKKLFDIHKGASTVCQGQFSKRGRLESGTLTGDGHFWASVQEGVITCEIAQSTFTQPGRKKKENAVLFCYTFTFSLHPTLILHTLSLVSAHAFH